MLTVWRLTTARFARSAFAGEGARLYGGRWNHKVPLVYTAETQSLALLEMLVQDEPLRARYVMIEARIPASVRIERLSAADLPTQWRELRAREELRAIGLGMSAKADGRSARSAERDYPRGAQLSAQPAAPGLPTNQNREATEIRDRSTLDQSIIGAAASEQIQPNRNDVPE